jgi:hypothetical protein
MAPGPDPLALDQQVCFALVVAARSVVALYRPVLERLNLTHPQYLVMLALWQRAPLSVKSLAQLLQLDPGTLSPLLKRRTQALEVPPAIMEQLGMTVPELQDLHAALSRVLTATIRTE